MTLRIFFKFWVPVLLWMMVIYLASTDLLSAEETSRFLIPFLRWLKPDIAPATLTSIHFFVRKAAHFIQYAIFAIFLWRAIHYGTVLRWNFLKEAALALCCAILYAAGDEFHQSFTESRGSSPWDVTIDGAGALLGIAACWSVAGKRKDRRV